LIAEAARFGMDALVEVHDEAEMQRALTLDARLIGINNRNLRDLSIDLSTTERLTRMAQDRVLISESGIGSRADVERLSEKVDGFLDGTSLKQRASLAFTPSNCMAARTPPTSAPCAARFRTGPKYGQPRLRARKPCR